MCAPIYAKWMVDLLTTQLEVLNLTDPEEIMLAVVDHGGPRFLVIWQIWIISQWHWGQQNPLGR